MGQLTEKAYNSLRILYSNVFRALFERPRYCSASGMFADEESSNRVLKMIGYHLDTL